MKYLVYLNLLITIVLIGVSVKTSINTKKIAFVRTSELLNKYKGTEEAYQKLEEYKLKNGAQIDSSKKRFEEKLQQFQLKFNGKLSTELQQSLQIEKYNILKNEEEFNELVQKQDNEMSKGILNQVNASVTKYAEVNHYDIIFGTIESGTILYGDDAVDVTEDLLKVLNEQYAGVKK